MTNSSSGTRREAAKQQTRRLILDAAYRLFESKGFRETTMRQLATQAGVGLGTIFKHFPDKAFLLVEAFETDVGQVVDRAFDSLPATGIRQQLVHIAGTLFEHYAQRPQLSLRMISEVTRTEGEAAAKLHRQMGNFVARIAALFETAQRRGEISPGTNCLDAAQAFWSYYIMCLSTGLWATPPNLPAQLAMLDRLVKQHFTGIGTSTETEPCT